jgi:hypothetical protein
MLSVAQPARISPGPIAYGLPCFTYSLQPTAYSLQPSSSGVSIAD